MISSFMRSEKKKIYTNDSEGNMSLSNTKVVRKNEFADINNVGPMNTMMLAQMSGQKNKQTELVSTQKILKRVNLKSNSSKY